MSAHACLYAFLIHQDSSHRLVTTTKCRVFDKASHCPNIHFLPANCQFPRGYNYSSARRVGPHMYGCYLTLYTISPSPPSLPFTKQHLRAFWNTIDIKSRLKGMYGCYRETISRSRKSRPFSPSRKIENKSAARGCSPGTCRWAYVRPF